MAQFQNIYSAVFLHWPSTKIAKMVLQLNKMVTRTKNRKTFKRHPPLRPVDRFQNNFTEVFLLWPSTKIAKMVPLGWSKWLPELKIEILKWVHRNVPLIPIYQIVKMIPLCWTKWSPELKIEKKNTFKWLILGQWQDFKIISHKCFSYPQLSELLK